MTFALALLKGEKIRRSFRRWFRYFTPARCSFLKSERILFFFILFQFLISFLICQLSLVLFFSLSLFIYISHSRLTSSWFFSSIVYYRRSSSSLSSSKGTSLLIIRGDSIIIYFYCLVQDHARHKWNTRYELHTYYIFAYYTLYHIHIHRHKIHTQITYILKTTLDLWYYKIKLLKTRSTWTLLCLLRSVIIQILFNINASLWMKEWIINRK